MAKEKGIKNKRHFFKDFKAELKRVIWPTPKQLTNNTIAVIAIVLITATIVFVLDLVFEMFNTHGINKLKEMAKNQTVIEQVVSGDSNNVEENTTENTAQNVENVQ